MQFIFSYIYLAICKFCTWSQNDEKKVFSDLGGILSAVFQLSQKSSGIKINNGPI